MWEDPINERGGCWAFRPNVGADMDALWLETMLMLIGEDYCSPAARYVVNGAVVSLKRKGKNKIAIWTRLAIR